MEQLANLPAPALVALGVTLAVILGIRYLGLWQGQQTSPASSPASAQVAAVIVDPTALNRATAALEAHTVASLKLVKVGEDIGESIDHLKVEADRLREEMRIHREINRRGGL